MVRMLNGRTNCSGTTLALGIGSLSALSGSNASPTVPSPIVWTNAEYCGSLAWRWETVSSITRKCLHNGEDRALVQRLKTRRLPPENNAKGCSRPHRPLFEHWQVTWMLVLWPVATGDTRRWRSYHPLQRSCSKIPLNWPIWCLISQLSAIINVKCAN